MEATTEQTGSHAIEQLQGMRFRSIMRMYTERLAFTTRGNFAFIAGLLFWISYNSQKSPAESSMNLPAGIPADVVSLLVESAMGGITILGGIMMGVCVLMLLDFYEHEVGLVVDAEN